MKKKLLATILLIALLFNNYIVMAAGVAYTRSGGENLYGFASIIEDSTIDAKYSAKSNKIAVNEADVNIPSATIERIKDEYLTAKIQLDYGDKVDVGSIIYRNAITYNNEDYDVKLTIQKISSDIGSGQVDTPYVDFTLGKLNDGLDPTKLTQDDIKFENFRKPITIDIHANGMAVGSDGVSNKVETKTNY